MATDLFLEMAELPALPATGSLGTGQLDTHDLLVAGVPISISSKYLYLYLELSGSTIPVECILPAWKPYVLQFQWPPPDVTWWAQMNKFKRSPVITTRCH